MAARPRPSPTTSGGAAQPLIPPLKPRPKPERAMQSTGPESSMIKTVPPMASPVSPTPAPRNRPFLLAQSSSHTNAVTSESDITCDKPPIVAGAVSAKRAMFQKAASGNRSQISLTPAPRKSRPKLPDRPPINAENESELPVVHVNVNALANQLEQNFTAQMLLNRPKPQARPPVKPSLSSHTVKSLAGGGEEREKEKLSENEGPGAALGTIKNKTTFTGAALKGAAIPSPRCDVSTIVMGRHESITSLEKSSVPPRLPPRNEPRTSGPRGKAIVDFTGETAQGELAFFKDEIVFFNRKINDQWWAGELPSGEHGIFPISFVEVIQPLPGLPTRPSMSHSKSPTAPSLLKAVAMFNFEAESPEELSFVEGECIELIGRVNDEWLQGRVARRTGMFPAAYIQTDATALLSLPEFIPEINDTKSDSAASDEAVGQVVKGLYDFEPMSADELGFPAGAHIKVIGRENEEWLRGEFNGRTGIFPMIYVEDIESSESGTVPQSSTAELAGPHAIALHDFEAETNEELSFVQGDTLLLLSKVNEDWLEGENDRTYSIGIFPRAFVDVRVDLP